MRKHLAIMLFCLLLLCAGCGAYSYDDQYLNNRGQEDESDSEPVTDISELLQGFETVDLQGNTVDSSFFENNELTLVNIWTTWCGPCKEELPSLQNMAEKYADQGFAVLGLLQDGVSGKNLVPDEKAMKNAEKLLIAAGAEYTVIIPDNVINNNLLHAITGFPTSFFVDGEGKVIAKSFILGALDEQQWSEVIEKMLEGIADEE